MPFALKADFKGYEDLREALLANPLKFGSTDKTVLELTKELMAFISDTVAEKTMNGNKAKVGFSSSHYIIISKGVGASLDGRHSGAPFAVHISPVSSKIDLQEVLDFAVRWIIRAIDERECSRLYFTQSICGYAG